MIKMFSLSDVNHYFDNQTIDQAQQLRQNNALSRLQQPIKKLWACAVNDGNAYEVEVQLFGLKVKAYTCNCLGFSQKNSCKHTVALMLQLKSFLIDPKKVKQEESLKRADKDDISIQKVLSNTSREDLLEFIIDYAKTDKKMSFAVKAKFLSENDDLFDLKLYTNLLNDTIRSFKGPNGQLTNKGWSQIDKIFKDLLYKSRGKILEKEYVVAVEILKPIYLITMQLSRGSNAPLYDLKPFFSRTIEYLNLMATNTLTPKIKTQIAEFIAEDYKLFPYQPFAFDLIFYYTKQIENLGIIPLFNTIHAELFEEKPGDKIIALRQIHLLKHVDKVEKAIDLTETLYPTENELLTFAKLALSDNLLNIAFIAAKSGYSKYNKAQAFGEILLRIATIQDDKDMVLIYARELFTLYPQIRYYEALTIIGMETKILNELFLKTEMTVSKREGLNIEIDIMNKNYIAAIDKINNINDLIYFTETFIMHAKEPYLAKLKIIVSDYLELHIGKTPAVIIKDLIRKMHKLHASDTAAKFTEWLRDSYEDRFALLEEISLFRN
jgi:hypothetical protein